MNARSVLVPPASSVLSARRARTLAGVSALALTASGVLAAGPAVAADDVPDAVTIPGSYGRQLGCLAAFDIDCPSLTYAPETGDFRGTFELDAGNYEYYAFTTTGNGGAGYGPTGEWTGDFYQLDHPGGSITFVYDPATRLVSIDGQEGTKTEGPQEPELPAQPEVPVAPSVPQLPANVILTADNSRAKAAEFGLDIPEGATIISGDWDGDGVDTLAWRVGNRFTFTSANQDGGGEWSGVWYGRASDEVLVGDWDGDGKDSLGIRRGNAFHLSNSLYSGRADVFFWYGKPSDDVVVADFDGDATDTISVRRGNAFHVNNAHKGGSADRVFWYGRAGEEFLIGDLNGDGKDSVTIRRGPQFHLKYTQSSGNADAVAYLGEAKDAALLGDWDCDGRDTIGVSLR